MNNRTKLLAVIACLILAFSFCLYGCGASSTDSESASTSAPEKHLLGYPDGYDTTSGGGSSYDGWCDNPDTPYFKINDYYNMESDGTLHILTNFASYQQSTEYSCGPACGVMVLNWFGGDINKYDELTICKFSGTTEDAGTDAEGMNGFFQDELGWYTEFNFSTTEKFNWDDSEDPLQDFEDYCVKMIDNGVPIMVDWSDWGGHWQCIIGIDTCQEDNSADDVLILADPYDTSDQYQDGYYTYSAERFFYQWHEGEASTLDGPAQQPYLVAMPMEKAEELGLK